MSSIGGRKSFIKKLESSTVIDLLTLGVLLFDGYIIYGSMDRYGADITSFASTPETLAVQLTAGAVVLYVLEFLSDKAGGSGGPLS